MHRHEQITLTDIPNPRPLRIPAMCAIVAVASLRETVGLPRIVLPAHQDQRAVVPPDAPNRITIGLIPQNATRCGDFGELISADDFPV